MFVHVHVHFHVYFSQLTEDVQSLKQQVLAFQTSLEAKDSVVMSMADQLEAHKHAHLLETPAEAPANPPAAVEDVQQLHDVIGAYKLQNSLLNNEILELNRLRESCDTMARDTLRTCIKLETCYFDVHRKYVQCLAELGKREENGEK